MKRPFILLMLPGLITAVALGIQVGSAAGCTIDGKATAYANGLRANVTRGVFSSVAVRTWAPFSFVGRFNVRGPIRFSEDNAELKRVLPAAATAAHRPWRWDFGDGTLATGWSASHRYAHPGAYRISVDAYYPSWRRYFSFDLVRLIVSR